MVSLSIAAPFALCALAAGKIWVARRAPGVSSAPEVIRAIGAGGLVPLVLILTTGAPADRDVIVAAAATLAYASAAFIELHARSHTAAIASGVGLLGAFAAGVVVAAPAESIGLIPPIGLPVLGAVLLAAACLRVRRAPVPGHSALGVAAGTLMVAPSVGSAAQWRVLLALLFVAGLSVGLAVAPRKPMLLAAEIPARTVTGVYIGAWGAGASALPSFGDTAELIVGVFVVIALFLGAVIQGLGILFGARRFVVGTVLSAVVAPVVLIVAAITAI